MGKISQFFMTILVIQFGVLTFGRAVFPLTQNVDNWTKQSPEEDSSYSRLCAKLVDRIVKNAPKELELATLVHIKSVLDLCMPDGLDVGTLLRLLAIKNKIMNQGWPTTARQDTTSAPLQTSTKSSTTTGMPSASAKSPEDDASSKAMTFEGNSDNSSKTNNETVILEKSPSQEPEESYTLGVDDFYNLTSFDWDAFKKMLINTTTVDKEAFVAVAKILIDKLKNYESDINREEIENLTTARQTSPTKLTTTEILVTSATSPSIATSKQTTQPSQTQTTDNEQLNLVQQILQQLEAAAQETTTGKATTANDIATTIEPISVDRVEAALRCLSDFKRDGYEQMGLLEAFKKCLSE